MSTKKFMKRISTNIVPLHCTQQHTMIKRIPVTRLENDVYHKFSSQKILVLAAICNVARVTAHMGQVSQTSQKQWPFAGAEEHVSDKWELIIT